MERPGVWHEQPETSCGVRGDQRPQLAQRSVSSTTVGSPSAVQLHGYASASVQNGCARKRVDSAQRHCATVRRSLMVPPVTAPNAMVMPRFQGRHCWWNCGCAGKSTPRRVSVPLSRQRPRRDSGSSDATLCADLEHGVPLSRCGVGRHERGFQRTRPFGVDEPPALARLETGSAFHRRW